MATVSIRQRGMTTIGMVFIIAMIAVFVFVGLKLYPIYYDSFKVGTALNSLKSEPDLASKPAHEIADRFMKRLSIDNVDSVEKSDIAVEKSGTRATVSVDYEVQESLIGNIDVLVHFEKEVEIGN
jgi:hypothetical protein